MDTTDYTNKAPYLNDEKIDLPQITIDEYYYDELVKIKYLTKRYFKLLNYPLEKTNDEIQEMNNINKKLKKLL